MAPSKKSPNPNPAAGKFAVVHDESTAVGDYLRLIQRKPAAPGKLRPSKPETLRKWLAAAEKAYVSLEGVARIKKLQRIRELRDALGEAAKVDDDKFLRIEEGFVANAKSFADRHGIAYATFREEGVPPEVLKRAGIARS